MTEGTPLSGLSLDSGWLAAMGMELSSAEKDRVEFAWSVGPEHLQPFGIVHGGVYSGAVETACSIGAVLNVEDGSSVAGVENHTSFLRSVTAGRLTVVATPIHRGRSTQLWEASITDEQQRLVATGRVRLMVLDRTKQGGE